MCATPRVPLDSFLYLLNSPFSSFPLPTLAVTRSKSRSDPHDPQLGSTGAHDPAPKIHSSGAMAIGSPKSLSGLVAVPRSLTSLLISVALLAAFLVLACRFLVSFPISSTFNEDGSTNAIGFVHPSTAKSERNELGLRGFNSTSISLSSTVDIEGGGRSSDERSASKNDTLGVDMSRSSVVTFDNATESGNSSSLSMHNSTRMIDLHSPDTSNGSLEVDSGNCDIYHGKWVYDPAGPLYTNNSCPILTQMQNCQGNGRPDKEYENWRWKPDQCVLPRFDGRKYLELMRGKTLAFVGDSVARNQMESMLCILWQVEVPKNRGNRRMQRWFFRSTSTMIVRVWSSWLVHQTTEPIEFAPESLVKLHLDAPDENLMQLLPGFDVVVLSSGHWFAKQSVYVLDNKIVGGQLWWPDKGRPMQTNNVEAFGVSVETILSAIATHPNYTGITIVRSFSPDHYEGGAWNTGGSCTGKTRPATELVRNGFTDVMHEKQVAGFERAAKKVRENGPKLRLMDITEMFAYRYDGHPGPYRNPDPNKVTKRGPDGRPPPQDCLHWCMPGPVDTWNELILEILRREFEGL